LPSGDCIDSMRFLSSAVMSVMSIDAIFDPASAVIIIL
jgi:hypothetical protein